VVFNWIELVELLKQFPMTKTIATRYLEFVRVLCGWIVVMDEGKTMDDGNEGEILDDVDLLKT
jgi:energy-coupling factor transporter ATP-binding protein EcfA2